MLGEKATLLSRQWAIPSSSALQLTAYCVCRLLTTLFLPTTMSMEFSSRVRSEATFSSIIAFPHENYRVSCHCEPAQHIKNHGVPLPVGALRVQQVSYEKS